MEILWDDLYDQKTKEISDLTQDIEKLLSLIHIPKPEEQNHFNPSDLPFDFYRC